MKLLLLAALCLASPALADPTAATNWNSLLDASGGSGVRFGVKIGGKEPFARNDMEAFAPASTAKLFTAGAALELLGAGYRYPTILRWNSDQPSVARDLTLIGSGDPSPGLSELRIGLRAPIDALVAALKAKGITEVRGALQISASDSRWPALTIPEGWKESDAASCGGALAQALNFGLNCAVLRITSPRNAAWATQGASFPVVLRISEGARNGVSATLVRSGSPYYLVEGTWNSGTISLTLPIHDTRAWAANLLKASLAAAGIRYVPGRRGAGSATDQVVVYSPPLSELLKPFLKNSINFMGDAILKTLGTRETSEPNLLRAGLSVLSRYLLAAGGDRDFTLHDGSGLSRTSRVTPSMLYTFLDRLSARQEFPTLWAALAVAGVDGTLTNRMKNSAATGRLRAKTGTLEGVYNLAGYVPRGSSFVPFVILTRTDSAHSSAARSAEDRVGVRLSELHLSPWAELQAIEPFPYVPEHAGLDAQ